MQVSDRRLTLANSIASVPVTVDSDDTNKSIVIDGRYIFSFTGIARFRGMKSDEWFSRKMAEYCTLSFGNRLRRIAEELTTIFMGLPHTPAIKRLAYVGVGWSATNNILKPATVTVSNFMDANGEWLSTCKDAFEIHVQFLHNRQEALLTHAGIEIPPKPWNSFARTTRKLVRRGADPDYMGRRLAQAVYIAGRINPVVGKKAMLSCIPKVEAERFLKTGELIIVSQNPNRNRASFQFLDFEGTPRTHFGPNVVCGGGVMSNFQSGTLR
jgi:hypothetical protein